MSVVHAPHCSAGSSPADTGGTFVLRIEDTDRERFDAGVDRRDSGRPSDGSDSMPTKVPGFRPIGWRSTRSKSSACCARARRTVATAARKSSMRCATRNARAARKPRYDGRCRAPGRTAADRHRTRCPVQESGRGAPSSSMIWCGAPWRSTTASSTISSSLAGTACRRTTSVSSSMTWTWTSPTSFAATTT